MSKSGNLFLELREQAVNGEIDPLIAYGQAKQMKSENDAALAEIEALALDEASKYEKSFEMHGFKFERRNGATRYSFKHIPQWNELTKEVKNFESKSKQALKAMESGIQTADENGEEIPLPEVTHSKDSLVVKPIK